MVAKSCGYVTTGQKANKIECWRVNASERMAFFVDITSSMIQYTAVEDVAFDEQNQ